MVIWSPANSKQIPSLFSLMSERPSQPSGFAPLEGPPKAGDPTSLRGAFHGAFLSQN